MYEPALPAALVWVKFMFPEPSETTWSNPQFGLEATGGLFTWPATAGVKRA